MPRYTEAGWLSRSLIHPQREAEARYDGLTEALRQQAGRWAVVHSWGIGRARSVTALQTRGLELRYSFPDQGQEGAEPTIWARWPISNRWRPPERRAYWATPYDDFRWDVPDFEHDEAVGHWDYPDDLPDLKMDLFDDGTPWTANELAVCTELAKRLLWPTSLDEQRAAMAQLEGDTHN